VSWFNAVAADDDDTDEGKATKAIGDDLDADLFTFNIVEEDFDLIKNVKLL